jgi:hypothetical protein
MPQICVEGSDPTAPMDDITVLSMTEAQVADAAIGALG